MAMGLLIDFEKIADSQEAGREDIRTAKAQDTLDDQSQTTQRGGRID